MELFPKRHIMRESISKGSIIDDKYGPDIMLPFSNELQELQEADTSFGEFCFLLGLFFCL